MKKKFFLKIGVFFKNVGKVFLDMLFPDNIKCLFCGTDVPDFENKPYCEECEKTVDFNDGHRCIICSEPIGNEAIVCDNCQKNKRSFVKAYCPFVYNGVVRKSVLGFKSSNKRYLARHFAKFIAKEIFEDKVEFDAIAFVPMTKKKEKERSFNQSKLLAIELGKILQVEVRELFVKTQDGESQKFLNFKERQKNMVGTYALKDGARLLSTEKILIVDDIITTCATINYLSGLIEKKVDKVYVASIARNKLNTGKEREEAPLLPF